MTRPLGAVGLLMAAGLVVFAWMTPGDQILAAGLSGALIALGLFMVVVGDD